MKTVSVYSEAGWQRDLMLLNHERRQHSCGSYVNEGKRVKHMVLNHESLINYSNARYFWLLGDILGPVVLTAQRYSVTMFGGL